MTIPSGSGTEVIKHLHYAGVDNATWRDLIGTQGSGTTSDHIYTIISIIIGERAGSGGKLCRRRIVDNDNSSNEFMLYDGLRLPADSMNVINERFSVTGNKRLQFRGNSASSNFNVYCTYIDQNWE